ncbi:MAG: hypothetical protein ACFFCW_18060 [Candidatus Hodarchaeota archaeon]
MGNITCEDRSEANPYIDIVVVTNIRHARNSIIGRCLYCYRWGIWTSLRSGPLAANGKSTEYDLLLDINLPSLLPDTTQEGKLHRVINGVCP